MIKITTDLIKFSDITLPMLSQTVKQHAETLPKRLAEAHYVILYQGLLRQKYAADYPQYSERYRQYKFNLRGHLRFWLFYATLARALGIFPLSGKDFGSGVIPGSPGKRKTPVEVYGTYVEGGAGKSKMRGPRPLFARANKDFALNKWRALAQLDSIYSIAWKK